MSGHARGREHVVLHPLEAGHRGRAGRHAEPVDVASDGGAGGALGAMHRLEEGDRSVEGRAPPSTAGRAANSAAVGQEARWMLGQASDFAKPQDQTSSAM